MTKGGQQLEPVLLVGDHMLASGIATCLQQSGLVFTAERDISELTWHQAGEPFALAILVTEEDLAVKKQQLRVLEDKLGGNTIIAINTETIGLDLLQENAAFPRRIIGLNWVEPADTTFFLEIITNQVTDEGIAGQISQTAEKWWNKDPYIIKGNAGVRMRLMGALIREAFYLVENGFATVEDIDRACRNDAGYYLPFAGNLRYTDLMGTYAYGMVMKDLNPELSNCTRIPDFFRQMLSERKSGMSSGAGFYAYAAGEMEKWQELHRKFSVQVRELIEKYPFNYSTEEVAEVRNGFNFR